MSSNAVVFAEEGGLGRQPHHAWTLTSSSGREKLRAWLPPNFPAN